MLAALPALISAGTSIYSAIKGNKAEKEARKQSAESQRLARDADANAQRIAGDRYKALDPFRNAAFAELSRAGTITPEQYKAITGGRYDANVGKAVDAVSSGPDRTALTRQAMYDYDQQNARGLQDRFRSVGSNAAKFGRLGMQVNEQNVRDVAREYENDRAARANEMIRGATEATVNDRYRTLDAMSGLNNQDIGLQQSNRQFDYGTKRDAVGDRNTAINQASNLAGVGFDNNQVYGASQNTATRGALGDAAATSRANAAQYGASAVDALGAAGRFLALPKSTPAPALDPNLLNYAANVAGNVRV